MRTLKAPPLKKLSEKEVKFSDQGYDERPRISFSEKEIPEIKDWKIKGKYILEVEVEQTGTRISDYGNDKELIKADFIITKIGVIDDAE